MAALHESGLESNTLVLFTTDHGVAMPRSKCSLYEPGVEAALILRLPGRKGLCGGIVRPEMVTHIDVLPTILDLVGVPIPNNIQGKSLLPLLEGKAQRPHEEIFSEMNYHDYYDPRRAIRTEKFKLIVNFTTAPTFMDPSQEWRPQSDTVVPVNDATVYHPHVELFDLAADPWELHDLAERPASAAIRKDLLARLHRQMVATNDPLLHGAVTSPHHHRAIQLLEEADGPGAK